MHTSVKTSPRNHEYRPREHPPHQGESEARSATHRTDVRRVGVIDRLALHLGVALIARGRRPLSVESRERRATRIEQHLARLERERAAERRYRLTTPTL